MKPLARPAASGGRRRWWSPWSARLRVDESGARRWVDTAERCVDLDSRVAMKAMLGAPSAGNLGGAPRPAPARRQSNGLFLVVTTARRSRRTARCGCSAAEVARLSATWSSAVAPTTRCASCASTTPHADQYGGEACSSASGRCFRAQTTASEWCGASDCVLAGCGRARASA